MLESLKGVSIISNEDLLEYASLKEKNTELEESLKDTTTDMDYYRTCYNEMVTKLEKMRALVSSNVTKSTLVTEGGESIIEDFGIPAASLKELIKILYPLKRIGSAFIMEDEEQPCESGV